MLPWVLGYRQQLEDDDDPFAHEWMDCNACIRRTNEKTRALQGCGWLPKEDRGDQFVQPDGFPQPTICPGYSIRLPEVLEVARARAWRKDGQLRELYDGKPLTDLLKFYIDMMGAAEKDAENHRYRQIRKKSSTNRS